MGCKGEQQLAASDAVPSCVNCWDLWGHHFESLNAAVKCAAALM